MKSIASTLSISFLELQNADVAKIIEKHLEHLRNESPDVSEVSFCDYVDSGERIYTFWHDVEI